MADCCIGTDINDLGCFGFCDTIVTGLTNTSGSSQVYSFYILGTETRIRVTIANGVAINFTNAFNEDSLVIFQIFEGNTLLDIGGDDCFQVRILPSLILT